MGKHRLKKLNTGESRLFRNASEDSAVAIHAELAEITANQVTSAMPMVEPLDEQASEGSTSIGEKDEVRSVGLHANPAMHAEGVGAFAFRGGFAAGQSGTDHLYFQKQQLEKLTALTSLTEDIRKFTEENGKMLNDLSRV